MDETGLKQILKYLNEYVPNIVWSGTEVSDLKLNRYLNAYACLDKISLTEVRNTIFLFIIYTIKEY